MVADGPHQVFKGTCPELLLRAKPILGVSAVHAAALLKNLVGPLSNLFLSRFDLFRHPRCSPVQGVEGAPSLIPPLISVHTGSIVFSIRIGSYSPTDDRGRVHASVGDGSDRWRRPRRCGRASRRGRIGPKPTQFLSGSALNRACSAIPTKVAIRIAGYSCPMSASAVASDRAMRCTGYASP
jgi:hypothetical protein